MKRQTALVCLWTLLALVLTACQQQAATNTTPEQRTSAANSNAAPADQKAAVEAMRALLVEHDKALADKNLDAVMATFSNEANTVVLGTGAEERWLGQQEIRGAYTEIFKDYDPNTLQTNCDWRTGGVDEAGTMAWIAATCACKDSHQGKERNYKLNVTAIADKQNGKWHFVSLHMSNAFEPPAATQ